MFTVKDQVDLSHLLDSRPTQDKVNIQACTTDLVAVKRLSNTDQQVITCAK